MEKKREHGHKKQIEKKKKKNRNRNRKQQVRGNERTSSSREIEPCKLQTRRLPYIGGTSLHPPTNAQKSIDLMYAHTRTLPSKIQGGNGTHKQPRGFGRLPSHITPLAERKRQIRAEPACNVHRGVGYGATAQHNTMRGDEQRQSGVCDG